jgi:hypothetical protein
MMFSFRSCKVQFHIARRSRENPKSPAAWSGWPAGLSWYGVENTVTQARWTSNIDIRKFFGSRPGDADVVAGQ